jgi:hypothetical protein
MAFLLFLAIWTYQNQAVEEVSSICDVYKYLVSYNSNLILPIF